LLDALQGEGLIELLRGYYPALGLSMPGRSNGRSTKKSRAVLGLLI
jgi:hypothetical protein